MTGSFNEGFLTNINGIPFIDSLKDYFSKDDGTIYVIVPFINNSTLLEVLSGIDLNREVCIVTSWRIKHLLDGVSSLDLYPLCRKMGWTLYINSTLHAKIYSNSFNSMVLSSANCTESALCRSEGNIEFITLVSDMKAGYRIELNRIISNSILVDDDIHRQYCELMEDVEITSEYLFEPITTPQLYVNQLPSVRSPVMLWQYLNNPESSEVEASHAEHDLAIYYTGTFRNTGLDSFISNVGRNFLKHPFISELNDSITEGGIHFGAFKELVQRTCLDTPVPYRKELTVFVQNLYEWFTVLFPDVYYIDVPGRRSEVLYRK